eukprot:103170_1
MTVIQNNNNNNNNIYNNINKEEDNNSINSDINNDILDDKMSQFAFSNNNQHIQRQSRKRRRSELSQQLPTKPLRSVDYNSTSNSTFSHTNSSLYESKPHQFRPPRMKKRKLNDNKFESPFIPKTTNKLALPLNDMNTIYPNIKLSTFKF